MTTNKANANQVNEKALQLLMQVAVSQFPVSAKTLSEQLNVPLSSLYRHLKLLKEWNLIEESVHDKTFVVGPAALLLMHSYETAQHGLDMVEPFLLDWFNKRVRWRLTWCLLAIVRFVSDKKKVCRRFAAATSRVKVNHCFMAPHLR